jgi:hypothetical protein
MEVFGDNKTSKNIKKFVCIECDFSCCKKGDWNRHIMRPKHINLTSSNKNVIENTSKSINICNICSKEYKSRNGLWHHKKKCTPNTDDADISDIANNVQSVLNDKEIIMALIKDNSDFKSMLMKVLENGTNNTNTNQSYNTNNSHNKTFNLQFFLNETCKNAMNIDEFVSSIKPTLEDLEHVGKVGYAEGISNIIIKRLNEVGVTERPIHCSDVKREVLYIKTANVWNKESDEKPLLVNAIKRVAKDNMDNILVWQHANPGCTDSDSKKNKKYLNMVYNSMSGISSEETNKNIHKIISKLSTNVQLTNCKSV